MINFNKAEIKKQISTEQVYELLEDWGGEPSYTDFGIISATICHNAPGDGSRKLYYYTNETEGEGMGLFHCYTGCAEPSFDIFELAIKVAAIQEHKQYDLNDAVRALAYRFGFIDYIEDIEETRSLEDWQIFNRYDRVENIEIKNYDITLKEYDDRILSRFNYDVRIQPWLCEGIGQEALDNAFIGFYPGNDQITIPHFDKDGRFIGLRGRTLSKEVAERYGKYMPIKIGQTLYNHPLGFNLYNLNNSQQNIKKMGKAIVFEAEKSTLLYQTYFGQENDISVACCGSSISPYQMNLLIAAGASEIVVAFDRAGSDKIEDIKKYMNKLYLINQKYSNSVLISFIYDKKGQFLKLKDSPIDRGKDIFLHLFQNRIFLTKEY